MGSIPVWGTKIPHAAWHGQEKKKKLNQSKFHLHRCTYMEVISVNDLFYINILLPTGNISSYKHFHVLK